MIALIVLYDATGETRFREAAAREFDDENRWFEEAMGNWPDFRASAGEADPFAKPRRFSTAWCHGAPGIALSRQRAMEVLGEDRFGRDFEVAWTTTRDAVQGEIERGQTDLSLCHGLTGRHEVLLERWIGSAPSRTSLEREVLPLLRYSEIEDRYAAPGLMLGLAGRAYALLRRVDREIPAVLLPRPRALRASPVAR